MGVLTNLTVVIISQYTHISNHHIVHLKLIEHCMSGDLQDGGGVRCEDHLPPTNTSEIHLRVEQLLQNTY